MVQHATNKASYLISQADRDGDGRVSECCAVGGGGGGDSVCVCVCVVWCWCTHECVLWVCISVYVSAPCVCVECCYQ